MKKILFGLMSVLIFSMSCFAAEALPEKYDLRDYGRVTSVKNQGQAETCWAFSAIGAMESNYLSQGLNTPECGLIPDLSEMHEAWFVYKDPEEGHSFPFDPNKDVLNAGGNSYKNIAFLSRLAGPVNEQSLEYSVGLLDTNYDIPVGKPEDYKRVLRLKEAFLFLVKDENNEYIAIDTQENTKDLIKRTIMLHGAVDITYHHSEHEEYKYYFEDEDSRTGNHRVLIVGWDDNISKTNFKSNNQTEPQNDGAWLIKDSKGHIFSGHGLDGYFWLSYEQYIPTAAAYIVEPLNENLVHYGYDDLGYSGGIGNLNQPIWGANVFQAKSDEIIQEVAFYTLEHKTMEHDSSYVVSVYDLGTSKPSSPIAGTLIASLPNQNIEVAGYHSFKLDNPAKIEKDHYFSVVLKAVSTVCDRPIVGEIAGEDGAVVHEGESYASSNGTDWQERGNFNPCIKAFTIPYIKAINENGDNVEFDNFQVLSSDTTLWNNQTYVLNQNLTIEERIVVSGNVDLVLCDGCTLTAQKGISVNESNILKIYGQEKGTGTLKSTSTTRTAAIGGDEGKNCGGVVILGGHIIAEGSSEGTGIGGGYNGNGGTIVIVKGDVKAKGGYRGGAGIGGGAYGDGGNIFINGGNITAGQEGRVTNSYLFGVYDYVYENYYEYAYGYSAGIGGGISGNGGKITINGGVINAVGGSYGTPHRLLAAGIGGGTWAGGGDITINGGTIYASPGIGNGNIQYYSWGADFSEYDTATLKIGTGNIEYKGRIIVKSGKIICLKHTYNNNNKCKWCGVSKYSAGTLIDVFSFPDEKFRAYVNENFNLDKNGYLTTDEIKNVTKIDVSSKDISSLAGISFFTYLKELNCSFNHLTELDVSLNKYLSELQCNDNLLEHLILTLEPNSVLEKLNCKNNKLSEIDVRGCSNLTEIIADPETKIINMEILGDFTNGFSQNYYSSSVLFNGGTAQNVTTVGNIPEGLMLTYSGTQATLSGYPTKTGIYNFTLIATDSNNVKLSKECFIIIVGITEAIPTTGTVKTSYSGSLTVSEGPLCSFRTTGTLPTGLSFSQSNNKITLSGVPLKEGTFTFSIIITEASGATLTKNFTVIISLPSIDISGTIPSKGTVGTQYTGNLTVSGGTSYSWILAEGTLPTGLALSSTANSQVILSGTPTEAGKFTFTLKVKDESGATSSKECSVNIAEKPIISGDVKSKGVIKKSYSSSVNVKGGTKPYTWVKSSGTLPKGLELVQNSTGTKLTLKGTPTTAKEYNFTLKVTDKNGAAASKKFTVTITKPVISGDIKANGVVKKTYSSYVKISGGTSPYVWTNSGTLPKGLELVPNSTGTKLTVKGTPTTAKAYTFTLKATDKNGATASKKFTVTITKPVMSGDIKANGVVKKAYSSYVKISGGTSPYVWTKSGTLPKGLELVTNSTGTKLTLKGTPTTAKEYSFTLKVTDKNSVTASKKFTVTITKPTINGTLTDSGVIKNSYSSSISVSKGTSPYTWTKSKGTLPAGLKLVVNSTGSKVTLKGTPTKAKAYTFTLKATDKNGATVSKQFTVTIAKATTKVQKSEDASTNVTIQKDFSDIENVAAPDTEANYAHKDFVVLKVLSDDILWQGEEKDEDLIGVRANEPLTFIIEKAPSDMKIIIDDNPIEGIEISDDDLFVLPSEFVSDDFKVRAENDELETNELFISVQK